MGVCIQRAERRKVLRIRLDAIAGKRPAEEAVNTPGPTIGHDLAIYPSDLVGIEDDTFRNSEYEVDARLYKGLQFVENCQGIIPNPP